MAAHSCPATDSVRRLIGNVLLLMMIPQAVESAVIEVTAGGAVEEPTYLFTESDVVAANLTARNGTIKASGDLETGSGNRVDDLASRLAAAESTILELQAAVSALQGPPRSPPSPPPVPLAISRVRASSRTYGCGCNFDSAGAGTTNWALSGMGSPEGATFTEDLTTGSPTAHDIPTALDGITNVKVDDSSAANHALHAFELNRDYVPGDPGFLRLHWLATGNQYWPSLSKHRMYAYSSDGISWTVYDATGGGQGGGCLCGGGLTDTLTSVDTLPLPLNGVQSFRWFGVTSPYNWIAEFQYLES